MLSGVGAEYEVLGAISLEYELEVALTLGSNEAVTGPFVVWIDGEGYTKVVGGT